MNTQSDSDLPRLYTKHEYFDELTSRAALLGKGDRLALMTMAFAPDDPKVKALLMALGEAARRGADILLSVDAHGFMAGGGVQLGPLVWQRTLPKRLTGVFAKRQSALKQLEACGGRTVVTNIPIRIPASPIAGRSHIKFGVINDEVWIGGCNLDNSDDVDLMAGWHDAQIADWLVALPGRAAVAGSVQSAQQNMDMLLPTSWGAELLVDAGVRGTSRIMQEALRLVDEAQERILLTCQFYPSRIMSRHLARAVKRGVFVELIYNHPVKHQRPSHILHYAVGLGERLVRPGALFAHQLPVGHNFIHAKLLVTEKATMLGSHNYVEAGVLLGTAEVALLSKNAKFAASAVIALRQQLS